MFKAVTVALVCGSLFALGAFWAIAQQHEPPIEAGLSEAEEWLPSIIDSAKEMGVELSQPCLDAITQAIVERGFRRAAVTAAGAVMIRDAQGKDAWVCR